MQRLVARIQDCRRYQTRRSGCGPVGTFGPIAVGSSPALVSIDHLGDVFAEVEEGVVPLTPEWKPDGAS